MFYESGSHGLTCGVAVRPVTDVDKTASFTSPLWYEVRFEVDFTPKLGFQGCLLTFLA